MTSKLAFINQKGGVGKTTLVANCGAYWARQGYHVLLIDLDPQAHLTLHLGHAGEQDDLNLYRVLRRDLPITEATVTVEHENLDIIPSHIDLSAAESEFGQEVGREMLLRDHLRTLLDVRPYDMILIDCPPSLGLLSFNALAAVEDVVIPVQAEFFALQGMAQLLRVVELMRDRLHPILKWRAIVPTLVDIRTNLAREVISELTNHFPGLVTRHQLRKRVKVAEAPSFGQSIFEYAPGTPEAEEFALLARELEERLEIGEPRDPARAAGRPLSVIEAEALEEDDASEREETAAAEVATDPPIEVVGSRFADEMAAAAALEAGARAGSAPDDVEEAVSSDSASDEKLTPDASDATASGEVEVSAHDADPRSESSSLDTDDDVEDEEDDDEVDDHTPTVRGRIPARSALRIPGSVPPSSVDRASRGATPESSSS